MRLGKRKAGGAQGDETTSVANTVNEEKQQCNTKGGEERERPTIAACRQ